MEFCTLLAKGRLVTERVENCLQRGWIPVDHGEAIYDFQVQPSILYRKGTRMSRYTLGKLIDVLWLHFWTLGSSTEHIILPYMQARPQRPTTIMNFQVEPCQTMTPRKPPIVFILGKVFCPSHAGEVVSGCGGAILRSINSGLNLNFH